MNWIDKLNEKDLEEFKKFVPDLYYRRPVLSSFRKVNGVKSIQKIYDEDFGICLKCNLLMGLTYTDSEPLMTLSMTFGQYGYIVDEEHCPREYDWDYKKDDLFIKFMVSKNPEFIEEYIRGYKRYLLEDLEAMLELHNYRDEDGKVGVISAIEEFYDPILSDAKKLNKKQKFFKDYKVESWIDLVDLNNFKKKIIPAYFMGDKQWDYFSSYDFEKLHKKPAEIIKKYSKPVGGGSYEVDWEDCDNFKKELYKFIENDPDNVIIETKKANSKLGSCIIIEDGPYRIMFAQFGRIAIPLWENSYSYFPGVYSDTSFENNAEEREFIKFMINETMGKTINNRTYVEDLEAVIEEHKRLIDQKDLERYENEANRLKLSCADLMKEGEQEIREIAKSYNNEYKDYKDPRTRLVERKTNKLKDSSDEFTM